MKQYLDLLDFILCQGSEKEDRTGTGTLSTFGYQMRFNLQDGFPLLTTKKLHFKSIAYELLWMLRGDTNVKWLNEHGVKIWNEWANEDGDLGPIYGQQWRNWKIQHCDGAETTFDQLKNVIYRIKTAPFDRALIVSAWNVGDVGKMALPPCHLIFQFYVNEGKLSCHMYQRSGDVFLGVPFNIASYALLTHMVAHVTDLEVGDFVHTFGDVHIYKNHIEQVKLQLTREPRKLPKLMLSPGIDNIDDFTFGDIVLLDYDPLQHIKAKVAV